MTAILFDFSVPEAVQAWSAIDDRVMGGVSRSRMRHDPRAIDDRVMGGVSRSRLRHDPAGHAVFEGEVSLARNGGFASVRSAAMALGQAGAAACVIEVQGDGKQFKLGLFADDGFDSPSYQSSFTPVGGRWQTLRLPLSDFRASFRGREVPAALALDPGRIRQVGLLIAARQAGPFALDIRSIGLD